MSSLPVAEGLKLAAKVLLKTMDTTTPSAEKVRWVGGWVGGWMEEKTVVLVI